MARPSRHPLELRKRAVRMVAEVRPEYDTAWSAMKAVAANLGIRTTETLRKWVPPGQISREFVLRASALGIRLSVGRTVQCWDNALAESFFATSKNELIGDRPWPGRSAAHTANFERIEGWYNLHRLHSSLGYRSPADYGAALAA